MATDPMDLLRSNLARVRIPEPTSRIHTLECCVSFDTPRSEGSLYVDMNTFLAFGKEYVIWNYDKTGNPVYLHIKQTKKSFPEEDRPLKKPTLFPIGVDEYEESYSIVVLPEHVTLPFPSVELPEKVILAVDAILKAHQGTKLEAERNAARVLHRKQFSPYYAKILQEIGQQEVEPVFGPGYTGLVNLGESSYLGAVMQVLFSTQPFCSRYYKNQSLKTAFEMAPADPTVDLNMQLTKLGHGLLSGKYSTPSQIQEGIRPEMLKTAMPTAVNSKFKSMLQQDAMLFFMLFIGGVRRANAGNPELDPSRSFKFGIEGRFVSKSGDVSFSKCRWCCLSLPIPLNEATNKEEIKVYHKLKEERASVGKEVCIDEIIRARVTLEACLANFAARRKVTEIYGRGSKCDTTGSVTYGLTSFPEYLVLHMVIFVREAGGLVKKLDVEVDVPEVIDMSHLRASNNNKSSSSSSSSDHMDAAATSDEANNGGGKYRLIGVVSHIGGPSSNTGHYVAHIYKDGRWLIFNDDKVALINHPPKDDHIATGYLYFFQRLN